MVPYRAQVPSLELAATRPPGSGKTGKAKKAPRPTRSDRAGSVLLRAGIGLLAFFGVIVLLAGGLYLRLSRGPLAVDALVAPIGTAINREIAPMSVEIAGAVLRLEEETGDIKFRLRGLKIRDESGIAVAVVPEAGILLSGPALLTGQIAPARIDLIRPSLLLGYSEQSGLTVSLGGGAASEETTAADEPDAVADAPEGQVADQPGIRLVETMSAAIARARRHESASSYLERIGFRDAHLVFDDNGARTRFLLPEFAISVEHSQKRSSIVGAGVLQTVAGPVEVRLAAVESEKRQTLGLEAQLKGVVPSALGEKLAVLKHLESIAVPVDADLAIDLSSQGEVLDVEGSLTLGQGQISLAAIKAPPILIDEGLVQIRYTRKAGKLELLPSVLRAGSSHVAFAGLAAPQTLESGGEGWAYQLSFGDAEIGDGALGLDPVRVDDWTASGSWEPGSGTLAIDRMRLEVGEGKLELAGRVSAAEGVHLQARVADMALEDLKRLWPAFIGIDARTWSLKSLAGGTITSASLTANLSADELAAIDAGQALDDGALIATGSASDVTITYAEGLPPLLAGSASVRLEGSRFAAEVGPARSTLPSGAVIGLGAGSFGIANVFEKIPTGKATFDMAASMEAVLEFLDSKALGYVKTTGLSGADLGGKASGRFSFEFPLILDLQASDLKVAAKARLTELASKHGFGAMQLKAGTIDLGITDKALDGEGDILVNGVSARLKWVRVFAGADAKQPPMRISATLDASDRDQLGIAVNHLVRGEVPVTVSILGGDGAEPRVHVQADLTSAELVLENMAWRKPPGQPAVMSFDVVKGDNGLTELQGYRISGGDISVVGWAALDAKNRLTRFRFDDFSFNVLTHLKIAGELSDDNVWKVTAEGNSYDGRPFFRSLFSAGKLTEKELPRSKSGSGLDLSARIGTMVGFSDTSLHDVSIVVSRRDDRLERLEAHGSLTSGKPVAVRLEREKGGDRVLLAEAQDAGDVFRLVGFYNSVKGGQASLMVNLDGGTGAAEKSGVLWSRNFVVLGDPVVTEVLASADKTSSAGKKTERMQIAFDRMKVPFSVGQGQLVLQDSYINGPLLGATLRGNVDFGRQLVRLGGTYVPMYGLNSAIGEFPILGDLLVGRKGEGIFGITFGIQGPLASPQVTVNPVSMVVPGVLRQIFEFNPPDTRIRARPAAPEPEASQPSISSSLPPMTSAPSAGEASVGEAWSAEASGTSSAAPAPSRPAAARARKAVPEEPIEGGSLR